LMKFVKGITTTNILNGYILGETKTGTREQDTVLNIRPSIEMCCPVLLCLTYLAMVYFASFSLFCLFFYCCCLWWRIKLCVKRQHNYTQKN